MSNRNLPGRPRPANSPQGGSNGYVVYNQEFSNGNQHHGSPQRCRVEVSFPDSNGHQTQMNQQYGARNNFAGARHSAGFSRYGDPVRIYVGDAGNTTEAQNAVDSGASHVTLVLDSSVVERIGEHIQRALNWMPSLFSTGTHGVRAFDGGLSVATVVMVLGIVGLASIVATIGILTYNGYEGDVVFNAPWFNDQPWGLEINFYKVD